MTNLDLLGFESELGYGLPEEYRAFLLDHNGGSCRSYQEIELEDGPVVLCDCLFGLGVPDSLDLRFWRSEFSGEVPDKSLLIGASPGGAFFLLLKTEDGWCVYYYDHAYDFPSSSDQYNTYRCFLDLSDLLAMVAPGVDA